jgi:SagB-type dehydrogenase family enzyme
VPPKPRLKRSDCLVFCFRGRALICRNYLTGLDLECGPALLTILEAADRWRTAEAIAARLAQYPRDAVERILRSLIASTVLVLERSAQAKKEEEVLAAWKAWGDEARFFHFATKDTHRSAPVTNEGRFTRALLRRSPKPPAIKRYRASPRVAMPLPAVPTDSEFARVLLGRRTRREFGRDKLSAVHLSLLLHLTWGITGSIQWPGLGRVAVKTSPSGGARHPLEVYVWALRIAGLPRGVYHYRPDRHCLELVRPGATARRVVTLCGRQSWVGHCSALFVMTAVVPRVTWRYRFARAYRVLLLEAGHFGQTFCLAATWLGLAPFSTAALVDSDIEADLSLDGASECVLYAAGVGPRVPDRDGHRPSLR